MAASGGRRPPQELETPRKILELERSKGHADQAVTGGLDAFIRRWQGRIAQGGPAALAPVAGAVADTLAGYASLSPGERETRVRTALRILAGDPTPQGDLTPQPPLLAGEGAGG